MPVVAQATDGPAMAALYAAAREQESTADVLGVQLTVGFPYADIADAGTAAGTAIEKREVRLPDGALRETGEHQVGIHLYTDTDVTITVNIVGEE